MHWSWPHWQACFFPGIPNELCGRVRLDCHGKFGRNDTHHFKRQHIVGVGELPEYISIPSEKRINGFYRETKVLIDSFQAVRIL